MQSHWKSVTGLLLLAPFVGEYLLGNLTVSELPLGIVLAPMYGFGALLVREIGRRTGGWPSMLLLAAAYALIEEGPVDQLLWNDSYAGHDLLHGPSFIPAFGMSVELTQAVLAIHTIWSICVPIALVEAMSGAHRTTPWLRTRGLTLAAIGCLAGMVLVFAGNYSEEHFIASPAQLGAITVVIVALIAIAVRMKPSTAQQIPGDPPRPLLVAVSALAVTSSYWGFAALATADRFEWAGVAIWFVALGVGATLVLRWTRQAGWTPRHIWALAAGATLTYVWTAFPVRPESGGSVAADLISNVVFGIVACVIVARASVTSSVTSSG